MIKLGGIVIFPDGSFHMLEIGVEILPQVEMVEPIVQIAHFLKYLNKFFYLFFVFFTLARQAEIYESVHEEGIDKIDEFFYILSQGLREKNYQLPVLFQVISADAGEILGYSAYISQQIYYSPYFSVILQTLCLLFLSFFLTNYSHFL